MGIARNAANFFLIEGLQRPYAGSVLQLGRQDIYFGTDQLESWAQARNFPLGRKRPLTFSPYCHVPQTRCLDDICFFSHLGFDEIYSCDASNYEGVDYVFDLNQPAPPELANRFDLIFDGGTLEHVFHLPQSLDNIHQMLKVGGRVVHASPVSNYVDHGFYSFSPTLFCDYYTANHYRIEDAYIIAHTKDPMAESLMFPYVPEWVERLSFGGFTPEVFGKYTMFMLYIVSTKMADSTSGIIPTQGRYRRRWGGEAPLSNIAAQTLQAMLV